MNLLYIIYILVINFITEVKMKRDRHSADRAGRTISFLLLVVLFISLFPSLSLCETGSSACCCSTEIEVLDLVDSCCDVEEVSSCSLDSSTCDCNNDSDEPLFTVPFSGFSFQENILNENFTDLSFLDQQFLLFGQFKIRGSPKLLTPQLYTSFFSQTCWPTVRLLC